MLVSMLVTLRLLVVPVCVAAAFSASARAEPNVNAAQAPNLKPPAEAGSAEVQNTSTPSPKPSGEAEMSMSVFLDRLMVAESGGRDYARNPRSTATGAYQFLESTFLDILRRHFPEKAQKLSVSDQLALRLDRAFSRKAAEIFTKENAAALVANGHKPTFPNLRLAFLLGPAGASRILDLDATAPVALVLAPGVIAANPFLARMTAADLIQRAARDISLESSATASLQGGDLMKRARPKGPLIKVRCNLRLASCKRWLALKKRQLATRGKLTGKPRLARQCAGRVACVGETTSGAR